MAQLVSLALTPVVTRIYAPADYASMALFSAIAAIALSVSTFRFDAAIPLPAENETGEQEALQLLALALVVLLMTTSAGLLLIVILGALGLPLWERQLGSWVLALPLAVGFLATNQVLFQYANRQREYLRLARITPLSKLATSALQILLGYGGAGRAGLIVPVILSPIVGLSMLLRIVRDGVRLSQLRARSLSFKRLWRVAVTYREFPLVATWISLLNSLNATIQVLILSMLFSPGVVGQYALAMALISLPVTVIAGSISSVFFRELASKYGDVAGSMRLTKKTLRGTVLIATLPVIAVGVSATYLFPVIFGEKWALAGEFTVALLPWAWARLIGIPLSSALAVSRRQLWQLWWQLALLAGFLISYWTGARLGADAVTCTWIASVVAFLTYILLIPLVVKAIKGSGTRHTVPVT